MSILPPPLEDPIRFKNKVESRERFRRLRKGYIYIFTFRAEKERRKKKKFKKKKKHLRFAGYGPDIIKKKKVFLRIRGGKVFAPKTCKCDCGSKYFRRMKKKKKFCLSEFQPRERRMYFMGFGSSNGLKVYLESFGTGSATYFFSWSIGALA